MEIFITAALVWGATYWLLARRKSKPTGDPLMDHYAREIDRKCRHSGYLGLDDLILQARAWVREQPDRRLLFRWQAAHAQRAALIELAFDNGVEHVIDDDVCARLTNEEWADHWWMMPTTPTGLDTILGRFAPTYVLNWGSSPTHSALADSALVEIENSISSGIGSTLFTRLCDTGLDEEIIRRTAMDALREVHRVFYPKPVAA